MHSFTFLLLKIFFIRNIQYKKKSIQYKKYKYYTIIILSFDIKTKELE